MVHVFCPNEDCRRAIHLLSEKYWNFKGKVKCKNCNKTIELEIKNGEPVSAKEETR